MQTRNSLCIQRENDRNNVPLYVCIAQSAKQRLGDNWLAHQQPDILDGLMGVEPAELGHCYSSRSYLVCNGRQTEAQHLAAGSGRWSYDGSATSP